MAKPSTDEYSHIGETTTRLRKVTLRSVSGENKADIVCSDRNVCGVVASMNVLLARYAPLALAFAVLLGSVTDRTTGQPLPGVTVTFGAAHTTSRADGSFRLTGVTPGRGTLTVESDDVPPQHFAISVGAKPARADLRVCSTTLDYNCGPAQ